MLFGAGLLGSTDSRKVARLSRMIEKDYDFVWITDERLHRDCHVHLAITALSTKKIRIGTMVTEPYSRHPAITAAAMATVNELSNGRLVMGIGAGGIRLSHLGLQRKNPVTAMREAVKIIRTLNQGKTISNGQIFKIRNTKIDFPVLPLPIYIAARGPRMLQLAGEVADGVIVGGLASKRGIEYAFGEVRKGAEKAGRNPKELDFVSWLYTSISEDGELAREQVKPLICFMMRTSSSSLREMGIDERVGKAVLDALTREGIRSPDSPLIGKATALLPDDIVDACSLAGTPEQVTAKVKELEKIGTKQIALLPLATPGRGTESVIREFADQVISYFK